MFLLHVFIVYEIVFIKEWKAFIAIKVFYNTIKKIMDFEFIAFLIKSGLMQKNENSVIGKN